MGDQVRIDKFLWCVRLCKTRSVATELCRKGRVRIGDEPVKPSREVIEQIVFTLHEHGITRTFRVLALLHNRVGAKLVPVYLEDLTPQQEYEKLALLNTRNFERRERGAGRPTKRERRDIDKLKAE
ncbi:MAG: S4 domain-containing protein [Bacteroidales bacterium]